MIDPQQILVAIDFSPFSAAALEEAFVLAAKFDAKVQLLHVFSLQGESEASDFDAARTAERSRLDAAAESQRASGRVGEVIWREGDPGPQIVLVAKQHGADLIVLGASGRSGMTRMVLGSVAENVVRNATCNVLVVRRSLI